MLCFLLKNLIFFWLIPNLLGQKYTAFVNWHPYTTSLVYLELSKLNTWKYLILRKGDVRLQVVKLRKSGPASLEFTSVSKIQLISPMSSECCQFYPLGVAASLHKTSTPRWANRSGWWFLCRWTHETRISGVFQTSLNCSDWLHRRRLRFLRFLQPHQTLRIQVRGQPLIIWEGAWWKSPNNRRVSRKTGGSLRKQIETT